MNSYVGITMVLKEQGQDDYFSQQSIHVLLTSPDKSSDNQYSTYVGWHKM